MGDAMFALPFTNQRTYSARVWPAYKKRDRPPGRPPIPMDVRFAAHVLKREGCWGWKGYREGRRPRMWTSPTTYIAAARYSYEAHKGPVPEGLWVLHTCDNGECTNPEHLYAGTQRDNEDDKVRRGRACRGAKNTNTKLTEQQVREIRGMCAAGRAHKAVATEFGVSQGAIYAIATRANWKWLQ